MLTYYRRLFGAALPGSLSAASTWGLVVFGLGLPVAIRLFGEGGGLTSDATFWLSWGTLAGVVFLRLMWAPYKLFMADQVELGETKRKLQPLLDNDRKANLLSEIRSQVVERMNWQFPSEDHAMEWCNTHERFYLELSKTVYYEVSPADANAIFLIGDASTLPLEQNRLGGAIGADHAHKMRWLRYYANSLREAILRYSQPGGK